MRGWVIACGCVLIFGFGMGQQAEASPLPAALRDDVLQPDWPVERVQSGIGYWRKRYDRAQYRKYRGKPGAQYELRQKRRNLCRNVPEMC